MTRFALTTALVLGLATPALANDQLARSLGVEPGAYSLTELVQLQTAMEDNDRSRIRNILNGNNDVMSTQSFGVSAGHAQLAASIGVNAEEYSLGEIVALRTAIEENDTQRINLIRSGDDAVLSTQGTSVSPGERQLALSLGVEPGQYTLTELVQIQSDREDD